MSIVVARCVTPDEVCPQTHSKNILMEVLKKNILIHVRYCDFLCFHLQLPLEMALQHIVCILNCCHWKRRYSILYVH